jgi:hypothetical protein
MGGRSVGLVDRTGTGYIEMTREIIPTALLSDAYLF